EEVGVAGGRVVEVELESRERLRRHRSECRHAPCLNPPMPRVPLLSGSRLVIAAAPDDAIVLRPPPPAEAVADVAAAVRDALRFPLQGEPLEVLVSRRTRATIVVEPPALPIPASTPDQRQVAIAGGFQDLERLGMLS